MYKEIYMYMLGAIVVMGFFAIVIFKLIAEQDIQLETGALIASFATVVGYFYGSSKSSAEKTKMLNGVRNEKEN